MAATAVIPRLDVDYTVNPADGDTLVFVAATNKWTPGRSVTPPILSDADAVPGSLFFGIDHLGKKDKEPMLCRKSSSGIVTVIG